MPDPSRLQIVYDEAVRVLGVEVGRDPRIIAAMLAAASSDYAASRLAAALEHVALALADYEPENGSGIVPAREIFRVCP